MTEDFTTELDSMAIILHAGNAKSCAYEALKEAKEQNFEHYMNKFSEANSEMKLAHRAHAELLRKLSSQNRMKEVDLLLVHAEGHLSSTDIAVSLIGELAEIHQWKGSLTDE